MKKPVIIADEKIPFLKGSLESLAEVIYLPGNKINRETVRDADALLIRTRTRCDSELLENSMVKFIATATIGYDHIDTGYCNSRNIRWTNAPGCNSSSVEQYIVAALLEMAHKHGSRLKDKTIGIIGVGNVGAKVARISNALGMKVLLNDPPRERAEGSGEFTSLEMIRREADIITLHVPLNYSGMDKTFHLVHGDFLSGLKKNIILFNTSRGEVVETPSLMQALRSGKIMDTVLDVWENEPFPDMELLNMTGIATPHIAGYSVDGKANGTMMSIKAISGFFRLGMDEWKPSGLPDTEIRDIVIDCGGMTEQEIIHEVYRKTYNILEDDKALRSNIGGFEELRGSYPVRREATYFTLRLNNNPWEDLEKVFTELGFSVLEMDCFC
ncbi:MAG: 4-phosphoerythronate dehydrogenase PdxB [Bacteroidales bacterium]|nr:4-phosphoerythronate dehydrogenase PdxB [Bacteroidales bacterium]